MVSPYNYSNNNYATIMSHSDSNYSHPSHYLESPTHKPPYPKTEDQLVTKNVRRKVLERQSNRIFPVNNWFIEVMEDRLVRWRPSVTSTLIEDAMHGRHPYQSSAMDYSGPSSSLVNQQLPQQQQQQVDVQTTINENESPSKKDNKKPKNKKKTKKQLEEELQLQEEAARLAQLEKERLEQEREEKEIIRKNRMEFVHGDTTVRLLRELDKFYLNYKNTLNNSSSFLVRSIPGFGEDQQQEGSNKENADNTGNTKKNGKGNEFAASPLNVGRDLEKKRTADLQNGRYNSTRPGYDQNAGLDQEDEGSGWCYC